MSDMTVETREEVHWEKRGKIPAGTTVTVKIGNQTVFEKDVPAGKEFEGAVRIDGRLKTSP
jgi:hypothetical protein